MMALFNFSIVPIQARCRWFVRRDGEVNYDRGFRSKDDAANWIAAFGDRLEWRVGFTFRLRGDTTHMEIVSRQGVVAKP